MKEKPILFSGPMVRAILDGKKTQTRRVIKPQPPAGFGWPYHNPADHTPGHFWFSDGDADNGDMVKSPFVAGQRLWVRETWRIGAWRDYAHKVAVDYQASRDLTQTPWIYLEERIYRDYRSRIISELDQHSVVPGDDGMFHWDYGQAPLQWRPSIHMPRWASRLTLEVVGVRVERLQDISEEDAKAEGMSWEIAKPFCFVDDPSFFDPINTYWRYWDKINAKRGLGWDANPWVWVIEFQRRD